MKEKIGIDFFSRLSFPSRLKAKGDTLYCIVKKANMNRNGYDSDLYRFEGGRAGRMTSSGDVDDYALTDEGAAFPSLRNEKDKEAVKNGEPLTVFQLLPYGGGEAREILRLPYQITKAEWLPDGRLLFLAIIDHNLNRFLGENGGDMEKALKAKKEEDESLTVVDELPFWFNGKGFINKKRAGLFLYDGRETKRLSEPFVDVEGFVLSESKGRALFVQRDYEQCAPWDNELRLLDIASETISEAKGLSRGLIEGFAFDGEDAAYALFVDENAKYGKNSNPDLLRLRFADGARETLDACGAFNYYNSVGSDVKMGGMEENLTPVYHDLYFIATLTNDSHLMRYGLDGPDNGRFTRITRAAGSIQEFIPYRDGFAMIAMRGDCPPELYTVDHQGNEARVSHINDAVMETLEVITPIPLSFMNSEGVEIFGWVMPPAGCEPGKKYPAILDIHGGPKTVYGAVLFHEMQYWCARGFAVLFCNPTGGDGRGNEFADLREKYGLIDYDDIMRFVEEALSRFDFIDKDRLGVTGGSYGGFMTNWIIGHTERFRAAASQRSIANWLGFNNTSDIGHTFGEDQMGGTPWNHMEELWRASPLKYADQVKTPALFIHSEEDYRCNMIEGIQMYYALAQLGVETRLCLFKKENHELSRSGKPKNRIRRLREITEWMETHL